jgi:hypothetical protein
VSAVGILGIFLNSFKNIFSAPPNSASIFAISSFIFLPASISSALGFPPFALSARAFLSFHSQYLHCKLALLFFLTSSDIRTPPGNRTTGS